MNCSRLLTTVICVAFLVGCATNKDKTKDQRETASYAWLCAQQGPHGILGNQDGDPFAGLYPNALAALAFLERGDQARCEKILDFFMKKRGSEFQGFHQFYDAATGETRTDSDRWIGDNSWLLIAINHYGARTGSQRYKPMGADIATWLVSLQDKDGGLWSGHNKDGLIRSKSTEGNLDAYAALGALPEQRTNIERWLREQAWIPEEGRFRMGSTNPSPALDTSAWGVLALGPKAWPAMKFANKTLRRMKTTEATGQFVEGYADFVDKDRIWFEGTAQMACAYWSVGGGVQARDLIRELERAMITSTAHPGTLTMPCHSNDPAWKGGSTKGFVPSVSWYLFAKWRFNPMRLAPIPMTSDLLDNRE